MEAANKSLDLLGLLVEKKRYISDAKSPMGYIVAMLRERVNLTPPEEPEELQQRILPEPTKEEKRDAAAAIAELDERIKKRNINL